MAERKQKQHKRLYTGIFKRRASNFDTILRWSCKSCEEACLSTYEEECYRQIYEDFMKKLSDGHLPKGVFRQLKEPILSDLMTPPQESLSIEDLKGKRLKVFNYYLNEEKKIVFDVEYAGGYEESYELPENFYSSINEQNTSKT